MINTISRLLKHQTREGFFPTYRTKKGKNILESNLTKIDNIGIHTFVIEKLLDLEPLNLDVRIIFQKGLDYVIGDAIELNNRLLWRWLKIPSRSDYLYPPDYDDTARARTVIEIAQKNNFKIPSEFEDFDYAKFLSEELTQHGVFTFVGDKPGNVVCPVVNANLLYSYGLHLKNRNVDPNKDGIYHTIKTYLESVADSEEFQLSNFSRLSKFYLSYALLAYLFSEQKEVFREETLNKVKERVGREEGNYKNPLETAWATSSLINLNGDENLIEKGVEQIKQSVNDDGLWSPQPFYQHQRLGNIFGSKAGTSIFCLETLAKNGKL